MILHGYFYAHIPIVIGVVTMAAGLKKAVAHAWEPLHTDPAIALAEIWLKGPLLLGLGATQMVLFALTVVISVLTVVPGRATRLQGELHLVVLAAYVFLALVP